MNFAVAPARERGLKSAEDADGDRAGRRSREGAWIEMAIKRGMLSTDTCRSRKGAWITINQ